MITETWSTGHEEGRQEMVMKPQSDIWSDIWYGPSNRYSSRPGLAREVDWTVFRDALEKQGIPRDLITHAAADPRHTYGEAQRELSRRLLDLVRDRRDAGPQPVGAMAQIADSVVNDAVLMMLPEQVPEELVDLLRWQLGAVGRARHVSKAAPGARRRAAFVRALKRVYERLGASPA